MTKDTINLRDTAEYEVCVFPNVYWVPANILGRSNYCDEDIADLCLQTPQEKQKRIHNLYEAIQLFQESKFHGIIDNVRVIEEDTTTMWFFHKNGYHSVRTNEGCCAADSNWLSYILSNKYDEIGCFGFCQSDGEGHIINYIKQDGWFYFVDMMMQRYDSARDVGVENGDLEDFHQNDASGYIYKAASFTDFINYYLESRYDPPVLFYRTNGSECVCIGEQYHWRNNEGYWDLAKEKSNTKLFYTGTVEILYAANEALYEYRSTKAIAPDWSSIQDFDFRTI